MNLSVVMNYPAVRNKKRLVSTPDSWTRCHENRMESGGVHTIMRSFIIPNSTLRNKICKKILFFSQMLQITKDLYSMSYRAARSRAANKTSCRIKV